MIPRFFFCPRPLSKMLLHKINLAIGGLVWSTMSAGDDNPSPIPFTFCTPSHPFICGTHGIPGIVQKSQQFQLAVIFVHIIGLLVWLQ